jgi:hypothetical protein
MKLPHCGSWIAALVLALFVTGCERQHASSPPAGSALRIHPSSYAEDERRLLFAQVVEDYKPEDFKECAIIEGAPYKWLLNSVAATNHDELLKQTNDKIVFENLMAYPGLYRGQVVTLSRGVVLEVNPMELPVGFSLPGYSLIGGVFVDSARDTYAFRMLLPPGSKVFERLKKGIDEDSYPVGRLCGYFMKLYARNTDKAGETPWRRPLLVCPEMEFSKLADPRKAYEDLVDAHADDLLPSHSIDAPKAEERLVVEVSSQKDKPGASVFKVGNQTSGADLKIFVAGAVKDLCKRLPTGQSDNPAAVILASVDAPKQAVEQAATALRAAGVKRLAVKREAAEH